MGSTVTCLMLEEISFHLSGLELCQKPWGLPRSGNDPLLLTGKVRRPRSLLGQTVRHREWRVQCFTPYGSHNSSAVLPEGTVGPYCELQYGTHVLKQPPTFAAEWGRVSILEIGGLRGGVATHPRIAPAFS